MSRSDRQYGIIILLDAMCTHQRISDDIDFFLNDWDLVLIRLEHDIKLLERQLSDRKYMTGISMKFIFDNIEIFYPTDDPNSLPQGFVDITGSNSIWWTIQLSADLLTSLIRYAITKGIFFRGCISMGFIREFRDRWTYLTILIQKVNLAVLLG
jgi:hypothetical protein